MTTTTNTTKTTRRANAQPKQPNFRRQIIEIEEFDEDAAELEEANWRLTLDCLHKHKLYFLRTLEIGQAYTCNACKELHEAQEQAERQEARLPTLRWGKLSEGLLLLLLDAQTAYVQALDRIADEDCLRPLYNDDDIESVIYQLAQPVNAMYDELLSARDAQWRLREARETIARLTPPARSPQDEPVAR